MVKKKTKKAFLWTNVDRLLEFRNHHISVTYLTKSQQRLIFFGLSSKGDMYCLNPT